MMNREKYLVTGGTGLLGNALQKLIPQATYLSSADCNLKNTSETIEIFNKIKPTHVIHLAAKVGGVGINAIANGDFFEENCYINLNVLKACKEVEVEKTLSILSTCVYSSEVGYPLVEEKFHYGPCHSSNFGYGYAKRMLDVQSQAYRQQFNKNFITAIPNNLYGEYDNFHLFNSHVIPSMIRKIYEAKLANENVKLWGDGEVYREFTYAEDAAKIILFLMEKYNEKSPINIGNTAQIKIKDLAHTIAKKLDYDGQIEWDVSKPKGVKKKPSSNDKLLDLGWENNSFTSLEKGLDHTCEWFKNNYPNVRGVK